MLAAVADAPPPAPHRAEWSFIGDDRVAVRARSSLVLDALVDAPRWSSWWRGVRWYDPDGRLGAPDVVGPVDHAEQPRQPPQGVMEIDDGWLRMLRVTLTPRDHRPGLGWRWRVGGDVDALSELWLEAQAATVVVHHLMWTGVHASPRRTARWRRAVRRGLWALKDHAQALERVGLGLAP